MFVQVSVNDELIRALTITNKTQRMTGVNTYSWAYTRHDCSVIEGLMSAKSGEVEHLMEDGAMILISKVAQAASESETP